MAIAYNSGSQTTWSGASSTKDVNLTTSGSVANGMVFVSVDLNFGTETITSVNWDSAGVNTAMTLIGHSTGTAGSADIWLYGLHVGAISGSYTIHCVKSGTVFGADVQVVCYSGAQQNETWVSSLVTNNTTSVNFTMTPTGGTKATTDWQVMSCADTAGSGYTDGSGFTTRQTYAGGFNTGDSGADVATTSDFSQTINGTSRGWNGVAVRFGVPAAAGPANLKTYNTNAKANIKTINTNAIANVKTLDTNA